MRTRMTMRKALLAALCLLTAWGALPAMAADEMVRLGVMKFASKAEKVSALQAEVITDVFTRLLSNSRSIVVLERERLGMIGREHKLNMSGLVDMGLAVEVGRLAGCQYMLLGSVTQLEKAASVGGGLDIFMQAKQMAQATIDARVVDVRTSEIVLSLSETGTSSQTTTAVTLGSFTNVETGFDDIEGRAIIASATKLGNRIRETLVGEYAHVIRVESKKVNINRGATAGVKTGDLYRVYMEGSEMFDLDGTSLGRDIKNIAVVKVMDVRSEFSIAEVAAKGGKVELIQRGDKIEHISAEEAKELAKRKDAFPKDRPRRPLGEGILDGVNLDNKLEEIMEEQMAQHNDTPTPPQQTPGPQAQTSRTPSPQLPTPQPRSATTPIVSRGGARQLENKSTDPTKVVNSYGLEMGKANVLRLAHINTNKLGNKNKKKAYEEYVKLANDYSGDYLASYRAASIASQLGDKANAKAWNDKALMINPNYEPAQKLRAQLDNSKTPAKSSGGGKKRRRK